MKTWNYKVVAWISVLATVGLIALYIHEFDAFNNTILFRQLLWRSVLAGMLAGALLGWYLQRFGEEMVDKLRIWTACIILPLIFSPFLGSFTNRMFSPHKVEIQPFEFFDEKPYASKPYGVIKGEQVKPDGYYLFVFRGEKLIRLKSEHERFGDYQRGDTVGLPVRKGLWGYDVVVW